jgi:hypothetical protein
MEIGDLFDFELNEAEGYWSVTGYYGRGEEVVFPSSYEGKPVKAIGDMFSPYNKRIKRLTIPEGYTSIGESAFSGCTGLTEIMLPESLTAVGKMAFYYCIGLTSIKLPENLTSLGESAFSGCGLTEINLPKSFASTGESAFNGCTELKYIKLPQGITSIGKYTFSGCTGLKEIKLPEGLASIGDSAFSGCTGLKEIKLPEGLTSIGFWAFRECTGLINIKIPKNLTSIKSDAFGDCTELAEISVDENNPVFRSVKGVMFDKAMITLMWFPQGKKGMYSVPEGIIRIRGGAFDNCKLTGISFPQSLLFIGSYEFNGELLTDITVNELNPNYCSIDGVLFDKENEGLMEYPKNKDKTDYTVPDGIMGIADSAFYGCKRLVNIVFPESLEFILNYAFEKCEGLKTVTLPVNLQYVGERTFKDCPKLETVTLSKKTRIGHKAFEGFKGQLVYRD